MLIKLDLAKTLEQNAEKYFEESKRFKKKIPGIVKTLEYYKTKLDQEETLRKQAAQDSAKILRKKQWYEKFRWFISSDGFLVIGGRDSTTNDIIIKKHLDEHDVVFHTELAGSPFMIIKNPENKKIPESTIAEAAQCCASYSKSWKASRTTAEVYWILPGQVSKNAPSGMAALAKGSFMINGKRNYLAPIMSIAICNIEGAIMAGPLSAIKNQTEKFIEIIQGDDKLSDVAKKIKKSIGGDLDEIIRALPPECTIKKIK